MDLIALQKSLREPLLLGIEDLLAYSYDGTAGIEPQKPLFVAFPTSAEELSLLLEWAQTYRVAVIPRGSGTGLSGGTVPIANSFVLCSSKMNRILEFDPENLTILVEPGVTTVEIAQKAESVGLFYPPDPGSMKISTIGGNVANNSGGLRGLKYGVTKDYVMGFEIVLAGGNRVWFGNKCVKDVAGYSIKDFFVGSEGTLGVFSKILLRLVPKPKSKKTLLAVYSSMEQAAKTVSQIVAYPILPCTLEFLDRTTIQCVEAYAKVGLPQNAEAVLLMETDGHPAVVAEEAQIMEEIARKSGAVSVTIAKDEQEALRLASARRSAFASLARVAPTTILEDITVPRSRLAEMVAVIQKVAVDYQVRIGTFGHMGDGNLHPTFLTNEKNHEEMKRVEKAMEVIFEQAIALGGTITGEHGVGTAKKAFLEKGVGTGAYGMMKSLKNLWDPQNILNPGKIFS